MKGKNKMFDLKEYTQDLHDRVEECYYPKRLANKNITKEEYIQYLTIFYHLHNTIETEVEKFDADWNQYHLDYKNYFRKDLLLLDLKNLDSELQSIDTSITDFTIETFAEAIGFMYVLTGSTMGGMLLSSRVEETPELQNYKDINNYFFAFREKTMDMFKAYMGFLGNYMAQNHQEGRKLANGARKCFEVIIKGLDNGK